ncbi:Cg10p, partial [Perkinsus olseni]
GAGRVGNAVFCGQCLAGARTARVDPNVVRLSEDRLSGLLGWLWVGMKMMEGRRNFVESEQSFFNMIDPLRRALVEFLLVARRAFSLLRVASLSVALLACGALQRIAFKRIAYPLGEYPILLLCVISVAFIPLFGFPYLYVKYAAGGTDDHRILPYAIIAAVLGAGLSLSRVPLGALNAVNGGLTIFGNAYVPGYLQTILQQTIIPFTMILSALLCGTRYTLQHLLGVVIIIVGVAVQLGPLMSSDGAAGSSTTTPSLVWSLVYLVAPLPVALAAVYQELEFSKRKVNLISLMYWSNLIQAIILFMLVPYDLATTTNSEVSRWPAACRCIAYSDEAVNPECAGGQAGIYLGSCILWMLVSQLLQAELVRHAGASLCAVVMTLGLPTTALAFSIPQLMGDHIEPIDGSTVLALSVILLGVSLYRSARIGDDSVAPKEAEGLMASTDSTSETGSRTPLQRRGSVQPRLYSSGIGIIQSEYTHDEGLECPLLLEHTRSAASSPRRR